MRAMFFLAAVAVMGVLCAAEKPYTCSLKVGTPKLEQKAEEVKAEDKATEDKAPKAKKAPAKGKAVKGKAPADDEEPAAEAPKKGKAAKGKAAKGKEAKGKEAKSSEPKIPAGSKVMRRKMIWPVTVSFQGKDFPSDARLRFTYIGTKDGAPAILGKDEIDVALDKNGIFKKEVTSPEAVTVKTRKKTKSKKSGGITSETTGARISGCVIQLVVGDEVLRSYATKPSWAKLAKKNPLPEEEILKYR